ncbi:MAG: hypothetical protein GY799_20375 [Desulfobulbaceae bacterium]|nr:hypothetical protein [Desulfobulbaceae bacterium]
MKDAVNLHQKVQGLCDCFATNDPLKEMSEVKSDTDTDEAALKWIALAILHGINSNAKEITISKTSADEVKVSAEYRNAELPSPGGAIGEKIINAVREISHLEGTEAETTLAFGIRNNSMDLIIKSKHEGDSEKISIKFP